MSGSHLVRTRSHAGTSLGSAVAHVVGALAALLFLTSTASGADTLTPLKAIAPPTSFDTTFEYFLEAELVAEGEIKPFVVADDPFDRSFRMSRDLIAQGSGTMRGTGLSGNITWSKLVRRFPDYDYGRTHITGWLETDSGAEILFKSSGYVRHIDTETPEAQLFDATLTFEADLEPGYEWLNSVVALWQGRLDPETRTFHYRAYVPVDPAGPVATIPKG